MTNATPDMTRHELSKAIMADDLTKFSDDALSALEEITHVDMQQFPDSDAVAAWEKVNAEIAARKLQAGRTGQKEITMERDFCSDERHARGCPCTAGGDVELRAGLRVGIVADGSTIFGGLKGEVVTTSHHSGTILVLLDGYGMPLPFGPSEIEASS